MYTAHNTVTSYSLSKFKVPQCKTRTWMWMHRS